MTIRKAIPLLWKYLLVVAASCMLAFVISQEGRASTIPALNEARNSATAAPTTHYAAAGAYAVQTFDATWHDQARQRELPIRMIYPEATAADADSKFPVIIFSHGLGGNKVGGKMWGEHWASHGYVVVHLQHPGSDEMIWKKQPAKQVESRLKSAMTMTNLGLRVGDVHFAIDEILRRSASKEAPFNLADVAKIGMSGHSFGAQTTLSVAGQASPRVAGQAGFDKRISASIAFSPNARNKTKMDKQFGDIRMPFFSITGSKDGSVLNDGTTAEQRTLPFAHMPRGDKYLLVLEGGDHMVFGGHTMPQRARPVGRDAEIQRDVKAATLAFWNVYLKQDAAASAWLAAGKRERNSLAALLAENDRFESK